MDKEQRRAAKTQLVAGMQVGHSWQTATTKAGLPINRSAIGSRARRRRKMGDMARISRHN